MSNHNDKNELNSGELLTSRVEDNPELSEIPLPYSNKNPIKRQQTANASKYPQGYFKEKKCKGCLTLFKPNSPSEMYCSDRCKDRAVSDKYLQRNYNITLDRYETLYKRSGGRCYICNSKGFKMKEEHTSLLCLDHDHKTGEVRGLLCHNCNRALGLLQDDIENLKSAIAYLESATTIQ